MLFAVGTSNLTRNKRKSGYLSRRLNRFRSPKMDENTKKAEETSLEDLKGERFNMLQKLSSLQTKLSKLSQDEEVAKKQKELLKKEAQYLNERIKVEKAKLEKITRETEETIENCIEEINRAIEKQKTIESKKREEQKDRDERRKIYCGLKGEMSALLLFKDYQDCVISQLNELKSDD